MEIVKGLELIIEELHVHHKVNAWLHSQKLDEHICYRVTT